MLDSFLPRHVMPLTVSQCRFPIRQVVVSGFGGLVRLLQFTAQPPSAYLFSTVGRPTFAAESFFGV
jgi:hypothetical protein